MAAPKAPNTNAASAARRRIGDETAAARLRASGWVVIPPGGPGLDRRVSEPEVPEQGRDDEAAELDLPAS